MNKKILIILALLLFLNSCAINPFIPDKTVVQPSVQPNGGWSAVYSPDGGMIAFLSSTLHTPPDLWVMNPDGTGARRLTFRGADSFRWSPGGKSIMFTAKRRGFEEVYSVTLDGEEIKLPNLPLGAGMPLYSPDGRLFALTAPSEKGGVRDLWIGTADGKRLEPVTTKLGIRNMFWGPDGRHIYYEVGAKGYGVGLWEMDLATMESRAVLRDYLGTPQYSQKAGLIAYAAPSGLGAFEVHTMNPDGSDSKSHKAPRLAGRWIAWDYEGKGVYYHGQDIRERALEVPSNKAPEKEEQSAGTHQSLKDKTVERFGVKSLWRLDFETGVEKRVSSENIHVSEAALSPDGRKMLFSGVIETSHSTELFSLDFSSGELARLVTSRVSSWLPVPTVDSSKIAFFTNEGFIDTLKIVDEKGNVLQSEPGFVQKPDTRFFWLPRSEGFILVSREGVFPFMEKGEVEFPNAGDHRAFLSADVSIQEDKILISSIPRFGESAGLYLLEVSDGKIHQTDLRSAKADGEMAPDFYLQPKWSFDGNKIAFSDGVDIWTMNADNTGRSRLTRNVEGNEEARGKLPLATHPVWSAGGDMICYTLTVYEGDAAKRQIWVMKADGSGRKMLYTEEVSSRLQVYLPEYTNRPFFDVTDEKVIFTGVQNGLPDLYSVTVKNGKMKRLTNTGAIFPVLFPEEGIVYYTSLEGNNEQLWVMNIDGTGKRRLEIKAAPAAEKSEIGNQGAGETEKKPSPAPSVEPTPAPLKEVDKPAAQTKETEITKQEPAKEKAPAEVKAPVKKKKPSKKKAAPAVPGTESMNSTTTNS